MSRRILDSSPPTDIRAAVREAPVITEFWQRFFDGATPCFRRSWQGKSSG